MVVGRPGQQEDRVSAPISAPSKLKFSLHCPPYFGLTVIAMISSTAMRQRYMGEVSAGDSIPTTYNAFSGILYVFLS